MKRKYTLWYIEHTELAENSFFLRFVGWFLFSSKIYQQELGFRYHFGHLLTEPEKRVADPKKERLRGRLVDCCSVGIVAVLLGVIMSKKKKSCKNDVFKNYI